MFRLFEPRTTLEKLREKYTCLMRQAYKIAPVDKIRSDSYNDKACKIMQEIKRMENEKDEN
ncbi:MAG TPA: Lacal_2735 family protein [Salinimicrobium sp.]|nr:Lacal_2735 family protein [Salinimicrobium sp.]